MGKLYSIEEAEKPYDCVDTAIGKLCVFYLSYDHHVEFIESLKTDINKCSPEKCVRKFSTYICSPASKLKEDQFKPELPIISEEEANKLTIDDLNHISKIYIENNESLYKKELTERENTGEALKITISYGDIEYPKKTSENYFEYLHRLLVHDDEKRRKQMDNLLGRMVGVNKIAESIANQTKSLVNFSDPLRQSLRNSFSHGESIKRALDIIRPYDLSHHSPMVDLSAIARANEERTTRPLLEASAKLDDLIGITKKQLSFVIESNENQTMMAGEIKTSGDEARKFSKINIFLTLIVILIALISMAINWYSTSSSNNNVEKLLQLLNTSVTSENKNLELLIEKQNEVIGELRSINLPINADSNKATTNSDMGSP